MRLNINLLQQAPQVVNCLGEREIDLRGRGITQLDEGALAALDDSFDVLNLCDNHIACLENFPAAAAAAAAPVTPLTTTGTKVAASAAGPSSSSSASAVSASGGMLRLGTLLLHNNPALVAISPLVAQRTPALHTFVANGCAGLANLETLRNVLCLWHKTLLRVSFQQCPLLTAGIQKALDAFYYNNTNNSNNVSAKFLSQIINALAASSAAEKNGGEEDDEKQNNKNKNALQPSAVLPPPAESLLRLFLIATCPDTLKLVNFNRVRDAERAVAKQFRRELLYQLPQLILSAAATASSSSSSLAALGATTGVEDIAAAAAAGPQYDENGHKIRKRGRYTAATTGVVENGGGHSINNASSSPNSNNEPSSATVAPAMPSDSAATTGGGDDDVTEADIDAMMTELATKLEAAETMEAMNDIEAEMALLEQMRSDITSKNKKRR